LAREFDRTFIVIDALDECERKDRIEVLQPALASLKGSTRISLLITSRDEVDIRRGLEALQGYTYIAISDLNVEDLNLYVNVEVERIQKFKTFPKKLKEEIIETLVKRADGM